MKPEQPVKLLYDSLSDSQKKQVCFSWDYVDKTRGLLRTRLENNWKITDPSIKGNFYSSDQQNLIRKIFEGMTNPAWHERFDKDPAHAWLRKVLKKTVRSFGLAERPRKRAW